jgi:hypothetical protein
MPSAFDRLYVAAGLPMLDQQFGEPVTVQRGGASTTGVVASWTAQGEVLVSPDGVHTAVVDRVWLVKKSLYLIGGVAVEPRTGDLWTNDASQTWEVLPSIAGPAVLSYAAGQEWEVKTKKAG